MRLWALGRPPACLSLKPGPPRQRRCFFAPAPAFVSQPLCPRTAPGFLGLLPVTILHPTPFRAIFLQSAFSISPSLSPVPCYLLGDRLLLLLLLIPCQMSTLHPGIGPNAYSPPLEMWRSATSPFQKCFIIPTIASPIPFPPFRFTELMAD